MSQDTQSQFPLLWYTSGTPMNVGQRDCAFARWLEYHAGPHGTGYRMKAAAVPLATGAAVHHGIELVGKWMLEWQQAHPGQRLLVVPDEVVAWGAAEAADGYAAKARRRGLELTKTDSTAMEAVEQLIVEQQTLIEAQVWMYAIVRLPFMLSRARLLDVEREETPVIDCTCGLGDWIGQAAHHAQRNCRGIVAQGKADFLWEVVDDGTIEYEEFKTKAVANYGWEQGWEHSGQLFRNMEAASKRLGRDVSTAYVPVLFKGKRDRWDREDKTAPKAQQSPLVYGWFDPGNGMTRPADWSARYVFYDDWGKRHTLPKTFTRVGIWRADVELPADNPNGWPGRAGARRVERWVRGWILPVMHAELVKVLGPFPKPRALVGDYTQAMLTEERRWRSEVEYLRELKIYQPGDEARVEIEGQLPETITAAHVISRSWACTRFDGSRCMFKPVCFKDPGWEQIETMGWYEIRTPHHAPEAEACAAVGVVFPEDADGDEDDNEH